MKKNLLFSLLFLCATFWAHAQVNCASDALTPSSGASNSSFGASHCFDLEYVQENCIPVYVKVNVHFFLDDNCEGALAVGPSGPSNLTPEAAFQTADDMVANANAYFALASTNSQNKNQQWNAATHGAVVTSAQCIPIRYVLSGVRIHCDSDAQTTGVSMSDFLPYYTNAASEVNIFLSNIVGSTATGFAGSHVVVENFGSGLFNHELGHVFSLNHTFVNGGDGCNDTWNYPWEWDLDGNGTTDVADNMCWDNGPTYNDKNACDLEEFSEAHPCCAWSAQNNNLMGHNAWRSSAAYVAVTPCQITRMLGDISENMCEYVADVGGCPPPSAFIGRVPVAQEDVGCNVCFYLGGSFNESVHEIEVFDLLGNLLIGTGEVFQEAGVFCIAPTLENGTLKWPTGFQSKSRYKIRLTVENQCGDMDVHELIFRLPKPKSCETISDVLSFKKLEDNTFGALKTSPNPFNDAFTLNFVTENSTTYELAMIDSQGRLVKTIQGTSRKGKNELEVNALEALATGIYFYKLQVGNVQYAGKVLKE
ncbi:MAG: T9SS type A sorting domain-containing protein [Saprospiraceae bacterium]